MFLYIPCRKRELRERTTFSFFQIFVNNSGVVPDREKSYYHQIWGFIDGLLTKS